MEYSYRTHRNNYQNKRHCNNNHQTNHDRDYANQNGRSRNQQNNRRNFDNYTNGYDKYQNDEEVFDIDDYDNYSDRRDGHHDYSDSRDRHNYSDSRNKRFDYSDRRDDYNYSDRRYDYNYSDSRDERYDYSDSRDERYDYSDSRDERYDYSDSRDERYDYSDSRDDYYNYSDVDYHSADDQNNNDREYVRDFFSNNLRRRSEVEDETLYNGGKASYDSLKKSSSYRSRRILDEKMDVDCGRGGREDTCYDGRYASSDPCRPSDRRFVVDNNDNDVRLQYVDNRELRRSIESNRSCSPQQQRKDEQDESKMNNTENVLSKLGISINELKKYLTDEIVRKADVKTWESSFSKLVNDKLAERDEKMKALEGSPSKEGSKGDDHTDLRRKISPVGSTTNKSVKSRLSLSDKIKEEYSTESSNRPKSPNSTESSNRPKSPKDTHSEKVEESAIPHRDYKKDVPRKDDSRKRLYSKRKDEKSSNSKAGTRIEEMLIEAGERSVNEFKKQQASKYLLSKLLQTFNYTASPTISSFPINPHAVLLSQSSTLSHVVHQQQVVLAPSPLPSKITKRLHSVNAPKPSSPPTPAPLLPEESKTSVEKGTSVDATLSLLRRSSAKANEGKKQNVELGKENEVKFASEQNEVVITHVVGSKLPQQKAPVSERLVKKEIRKVTIKKDVKKLSSRKSEENKTKVRVPSWFNPRCIELFKKRHKKIQQLKRAKMSSNSSTLLEDIKGDLRDIDREYIPLCKKTKSEYIQSGAVQNEVKSVGLSLEDSQESS